MHKRKSKVPGSPSKPTEHTLNDANDPVISLKEETIKWAISIICSLLAYLVVAAIVLQVYHPNTDLLINTANKKFLDPGMASPKPVESLLFRLGIAIIVPSLLGFYVLFSKKKLLRWPVVKAAYLFLSILCIAFIIALLYFDFTALNPFGPGSGNRPQNDRDHVSITNFDFYFDGIFMGKYLLLYLFFIVPLIASLFLIGFKKYQWQQTRLFKITTSITGYAVILWALAAIILMNTYYFPYSYENTYDFNAVYYSMTQVYAGLPMLVDGFTNTYGLYPHFLNPLFQVIGLSVLKFSLVMSLLTGLSFLLNFYVLKQFVGNKVILFLGFATVIFFPYLDFKLLCHFDSLFSLYPIRYIIPSTLLLLATVYFNNRSIKIYRTTFLVMALFILWNPEIGLVSYLSWLIVNIYADFYKEGKVDIKKIAFHFVAAIVTLIGVFISYELVVFLFYGSWPDLSLLFEPILFFGKFGYGNLPMSLIHPWNIMALILLLGFLYSLIRLYKKDITAKSTVILLISLIGLGYFFYFEGRSQNSNFAFSSGFSLLLLTILGDDLWHVVKKNNLLFLNSLFIAFLFVISFSFVEIIFNTTQLVALIYQKEDKDKQANDQQKLLSDKGFIFNETLPGQKIILFADKLKQALLFDDGKRASGFNPGLTDIFLRKDLVRLENTLRDSAYNVFIEEGTIYSTLFRPMAAVAATYEFDSKYQTMWMLHKRKTLIQSKTFFRNTGQVVIHRKYNDDTSGRELRINDAMGIATNKLNPEFSVEVLFYSKPQVFNDATIAGDMSDSTGFFISNVTNTSKYAFVVNRYGYTADMPYNQWSYCVMNVYQDHFIVYRNGIMQFSYHLPRPVSKQDNTIFFGSRPGIHNFIGAIAEIVVSNRIIDTTQIQQTWEEIKQQTSK